MKRIIYAPAIAVMILMAACNGGNQNQEPTAGPDTSSTTTTPPATTTPATPGSDIPGIDAVAVTDHIEITGDDQMKFDKTLFKVKAGQDVKLTLKNIGKLPAASMAHNVVILKPGTDVQAFGMAAATSKENEHIPADMTADVLAKTKLLGPGESDNISFKLDKGVYDFICTFPGHFGTMKGKIVAE